jgi:ferric-dicitrate binding protein FerR (iron transport regulator)
MDEIIHREHRGEASPAELQRLSEWRRASITNEHDYRRVVRLLRLTRNLATSPRSARPSAEAILRRQTDDISY